MNIILCEDVKNLGRAGDALKVADGFGRNYLLPKKLALVATPANLKRLQQELNSKKGQTRRIQKDAEYQAEAIASQPLTMVTSVGEGGKLFGSVTTAEIEKELKKRGIEVDKRKISLEEPIKTVGSHLVEIKIHPEVTANLTVIVQGEEEKKATEKKEAEDKVAEEKKVETAEPNAEAETSVAEQPASTEEPAAD
ncbi:50S ribosomal protein L9 [bacterium]|nr:50S ribosomal protein L9 [bacterium]